MSSPKMTSLSSSDQRDLEKYIKHFFYKYVQIVIQSRLGEKITTKSQPSPSSGSAWFNLAIKDVPEVTAEAKRALSKMGSISNLLFTSPICTEISLKTTEGDSMVLETWVLSLSGTPPSGATDPESTPQRLNNAIYNHMGLLLKSLLCATRVTPAYKLSRRQGPETFVVCYRIYDGEPCTSLLGEGFQTCQIGQVPTPLGGHGVSLQLRVEFRTKMTISSTQSHPEKQIMYKSDHFFSKSEVLSANQRPQRTFTEESDLTLASDESQDAMRIFATSPPSNTELDNARHHMKQHKDDMTLKQMKLGAFVSQGVVPSNKTPEPLADDPLFGLVSRSDDEEEEKPKFCLGDNEPITIGEEETKNQNENLLRRLSLSDESSGQKILNKPEREDFVLVDLKTPFTVAIPEANTNDLGIFFKDYQGNTMSKEPVSPAVAPRPETAESPTAAAAASSHPSLESQIYNLESQLSSFEENLAEYDEMLKTLVVEASESESEQS